MDLCGCNEPMPPRNLDGVNYPCCSKCGCTISYILAPDSHDQPPISSTTSIPTSSSIPSSAPSSSQDPYPSLIRSLPENFVQLCLQNSKIEEFPLSGSSQSIDCALRVFEFFDQPTQLGSQFCAKIDLQEYMSLPDPSFLVHAKVWSSNGRLVTLIFVTSLRTQSQLFQLRAKSLETLLSTLSSKYDQALLGSAETLTDHLVQHQPNSPLLAVLEHLSQHHEQSTGDHSHFPAIVFGMLAETQTESGFITGTHISFLEKTFLEVEKFPFPYFLVRFCRYWQLCGAKWIKFHADPPELSSYLADPSFFFSRSLFNNFRFIAQPSLIDHYWNILTNARDTYETWTFGFTEFNSSNLSLPVSQDDIKNERPFREEFEQSLKKPNALLKKTGLLTLTFRPSFLLLRFSEQIDYDGFREIYRPFKLEPVLAKYISLSFKEVQEQIKNHPLFMETAMESSSQLLRILEDHIDFDAAIDAADF